MATEMTNLTYQTENIIKISESWADTEEDKGNASPPASASVASPLSFYHM